MGVSGLFVGSLLTCANITVNGGRKKDDAGVFGVVRAFM
jgi:cytochrome c